MGGHREERKESNGDFWKSQRHSSLGPFKLRPLDWSSGRPQMDGGADHIQSRQCWGGGWGIAHKEFSYKNKNK